MEQVIAREVPAASSARRAGRRIAAAVAAGGLTGATAIATSAVAASGAPVTAFGSGGTVIDTSGGTQSATGVASTPNGGFVAVGTAVQSGAQLFAVARFTPDGRIDTSFGGGTVTTGFGSTTSGAQGVGVAVYPAGSSLAGYVVAVGTAQVSGGGREMAVARYRTDGTLDPSFGNGGLVTTQVVAGSSEDDELDSVAIQPDGSVVAAGFSLGASLSAPTQRALTLVRYTPAGAPDTSFGNSGVVAQPVGTSFNPAAGVVIQADGKIVTAGSALDPAKGANDFLVARFTPQGATDTGFGTSGTVTTPIGSKDDLGYGLALQPDGSIVVAGSTFDSTKSASDIAVARYTSAGALDAAFGAGGKVVTNVDAGDDGARGVAVEAADGKIVAAGYAASSAGGRAIAVVRYSPSGTPDTSFGTNGVSVTSPHPGSSQADAVVLSPAAVANTNIVVAGPFSTGSVVGMGLEMLTGGGAPPVVPGSGGGGGGGGGGPAGGGYQMVASDGGIFTFGDARFFGSAGNIHLAQPIVGMAATPDAGGYWLVAQDGGIFTYGDARFFGSAGNIHLAQPIVGMAATPDAGGYWLVARDGGIFTYGDAHFFGSAGNIHLAQPIVGMAATPDAGGYWLVARDGGIFTYGDAHFFGSAGAIRLAQPIVGMSPSFDSGGYFLVASDGGIFTYGDAHFFGSAGAIRLAQPIVGMATTFDGGGYWLVARDGGIFTYGDAHFFGSTGAIHLAQPMVGMGATR